MVKRKEPTSARDTIRDTVRRDIPSKGIPSLELSSIREGQTIPINYRNGYYGVNSSFQLVGYRNYQFKDNIIVTLSDEDVTGSQNCFVVDIKQNKLLSWFLMKNNIITSIKRFSLYKAIVDANSGGNRWEGDVDAISGIILGFGIVYDSRNNVKYKGFCFGDDCIAYGSIYYSDSSNIYYEGMLSNTYFCGVGKLYDRKGVCIGDGVYFAKSVVEESVSIESKSKKSVSNYCNHLEYKGFTFPRKSIDFSLFPFLKEIRSNGCYLLSQGLSFVNLPCLEMVYLNCTDEEPTTTDVSFDYSLVIEHCPRLTFLGVYDHCLVFYQNMRIDDCSALKTIEMGSYNFCSYQSTCCISSKFSLGL